MFKKIRLTVLLLLGMAIASLIPSTALAEKHEHERHHVYSRYRYAPRRHHRFRFHVGVGPNYRAYPRGYYDPWGYWHPYGY